MEWDRLTLPLPWQKHQFVQVQPLYQGKSKRTSLVSDGLVKVQPTLSQATEVAVTWIQFLSTHCLGITTDTDSAEPAEGTAGVPSVLQESHTPT